MPNIKLSELAAVFAAELAVAAVLVFYALIPMVDAGPPTWLLRLTGH